MIDKTNQINQVDSVNSAIQITKGKLKCHKRIILELKEHRRD